jgi:hypothetical protein
MKKKIRSAVVHIGTEKTGTTTIQEFLHLNREALRKNGVAFLKSPGLKNNRKLATYCMSDNNIDDHVIELGITAESVRGEWRKNFKAELERELNELNKRIESIIISSEHFHSRLRSEAEITTLFDFLTPFFSEIKIIIYLRRQDKVAVSLYSTLIRSGGKGDIFMKNIGKENHYYNYYNLLNKWSSVFGLANVKPRVFEKDEFIDKDLISDFIDFSGLIDKNWQLARPKNQNESISAVTQEVILKFNNNFSAYVNDRPNLVARKIRSALINQLNQKYPNGTKMPTKEEAIKFYEIFAHSNDLLSKKYFNRDSIFSQDFSQYPETTEEIKMQPEVLDDIFALFASFISTLS